MAVDQKVWGAQIAMLGTVLVFIIGSVATKNGLDIPAPVQVALTGLITSAIGGLVGWIVPMAEKEIIRRMDNKIVIKAQLDPNSPVSMPKGETVASLEQKLAVEEAKPS